MPFVVVTFVDGGGVLGRGSVIEIEVSLISLFTPEALLQFPS